METIIPFAKQYTKKMHTAGKYAKGHPEGLIVHFTAGRRDMTGFEYGFGQGYTYLYIDFDGTLYQAHNISEWGHHAGVSTWPGVGNSVSERLIGVEIACAGRLERCGEGKYKSWFGQVFEEKDVRHVVNKDNVQGGTYCIYSKEQEDTLQKLCLWLAGNAPGIFNIDWVLGHDECSPKRKNDPGGSLSMTMPEFRALLKKSLPEQTSRVMWSPDRFFAKMDAIAKEWIEKKSISSDKLDDFALVVLPSAKVKIAEAVRLAGICNK